MKYLLDTHILIWLLFEPSKLSGMVRTIVTNRRDNQVYVSAVSFWEISIKIRSGKIGLDDLRPDDLPKICLESGFEIIPLTNLETSSYYQLTADYHKDPFDRLLIWQAIKANYIFISDDENVRKYGSEGLRVIS
ncbi:type II toxin-antitoxin system VapC family toxin [Larkinella terrae]|uniref:PIN domain-containing protein n=1 Tax=Larkinella terrae TaxID=2025311 RepID=A0A7K0ESU1_9BACT|nr:type II toxin-antitoxin system VapC family toxin [Larkinella terrae]MRS64839.1 PIN domain-containing protein [Larkinella terrae]